MKFMIDLPRLPVDCGECPCSEGWGDMLICNLEEHESCVLKAYMPTEWSPFGLVLHPRPEWCPLVVPEYVCYDISHRDECGELRFKRGFFGSLDEAKEAIAAMKAGGLEQHEFQISEHAKFESIVYEEE